jgi:hypothetical protein
MTAGRGVNCEAFALHSAAMMATMAVRGGDPVHFPGTGRKVQLRIVAGYMEASTCIYIV